MTAPQIDPNAQTAPSSAPPEDPPKTPVTPPKDEGPQKVEELPEWAQKIIRETRGEAAQHRTEKQKAEAEKQSTLDAIATALGLKTDDAKNPEKLAADLSAAQEASRQRAVELAVYRQATATGGDPDALLDSRSFLSAITDYDPNAADFPTRIADAIKSAISANARLAAKAQGGVTQSATGGNSLGQGRQNQPKVGGVDAGRSIYEEKKGRKPAN